MKLNMMGALGVLLLVGAVIAGGTVALAENTIPTVTSYPDGESSEANDFKPGDEVWIDAIWLPQGIYNVWVVGYQEGLRVSDGQWLDLLGEPGQIFKDSEGNPTPSDTGVPYTVTANHAGQVNRTLVYIVPDDAVVGSPWEIVLDDGDNNSDGHPFFDKYKDGLDAYETGDYGFVVTPELPTAILLSLGLVGLGGYLGVTRRRRVSREARL